VRPYTARRFLIGKRCMVVVEAEVVVVVEEG